MLILSRLLPARNKAFSENIGDNVFYPPSFSLYSNALRSTTATILGRYTDKWALDRVKLTGCVTDSMLKAVLFDLDGTLAHTDPIHFRVWQKVLEPYGLRFDHDFYKAHFSGRLNPDIVQELLPHLSAKAGQELSDYKEACFREAAAEHLQPMPGLLPLLNWLKQQDIAMAIVTNAPRANAEFMLQTLGLQTVFAPVIISDDLPRGKPDPLPYQEALKRLAVAPMKQLCLRILLQGSGRSSGWNSNGWHHHNS